MECSKCGQMIYNCGSPHCESIKVQFECECGGFDCEYYTREEMMQNELIAQGMDVRQARACQFIEAGSYIN